MLTKFVALSGLAALAAGHMLISEPVPYGADTLNNSPLDASGSDFPCKQRAGVYAASGKTNVYAQGSTQPLKFKGSAVHGGGSCQISVTKDKEPTKDSVWKVIKSFEGGCPAQGQEGNLPADPNTVTPGDYKFTIPDDLAAGEYTLAWTWFNKIGNREMYMNCAPMEVTGSGGSDSFLESLPDMFVANIGNECTVPSGVDVEFPNPGKEVERLSGSSPAYGKAEGTGCQTGSGGDGGGGDGGSSIPQPTQPGGSPTSAKSTTAPAATTTAPAVPGGVFITVSEGNPEPTAPVTSEAPVATTPVANPGGDSGDGSPGNGTSPETPSGGFAAGTACTAEGEWNCVGGTSFQRCASGIWSALQAVSSGSNCTPGQGAELSMAVARGVRLMRRVRRILV